MSNTFGNVRFYKNHNGTIGYWEGWVEPDGLVVLQHAKKLDGKVTRREYQAESKNVGRSNETTPLEQGQLELDSRAKKQLDKGYVRTIEEAQAPSTNSLGLKKPMLATPIQDVKPEKIDWTNAYVQPKLDGHRAMFKDGLLYSRGSKPIELPHITEAIEEAGVGHLHLDGELYLHGYTLQELSKLIKKHRPESLGLEYHVYDVMEDVVFSERSNTIHQHLLAGHHISPLKVVTTYRVHNMEQAMEFHAEFREAGYEGTMLRFGDDHYMDGKRSRKLLKMKEFQDAEFMIVGVEDGKPYIKGDDIYRVPVYTCQVSTANSATFTVTAPGNMHEKHALALKGDEVVGEMLTVKFHYYSEDNIPQLPVALRFYEAL